MKNLGIQKNKIPPDLLEELIRIARDVSRGKRPDPQQLFELTKEGIYPNDITDLAESFGMMIIKVEAREFRLKQIIERLRKANSELEETKALLQRQNRSLKQNLRDRFAPQQLIGHAPAMQRLIATLEKIADSPLNVIIEGETGTGKEMVAKSLHFNSSRAEFPFVTLNCAALPESLLESELFGIEKGVATGVNQRIGRIEQAHRGTLFLDEIGDMPLGSQAKLLRVLEQREVERIGGRRSIEVDVRVVAATNKNLEQEVEAGRFRADLYYRLNVVKLHLPPLRERREDIPLLVNSFLDTYCLALKKPRISFSDKALQLLINYDWPGNIRELRNEVERCVALASSTIIDLDDLSENIRKSIARETMDGSSPTISSSMPSTLDSIEREAIMRAIDYARGNKSEAARILGISREGLRRKLIRYGIR
ncbi:MAG: sigma-54 interaction domain-containing protein [Thermodesulforhabdaceae bacterium]